MRHRFQWTNQIQLKAIRLKAGGINHRMENELKARILKGIAEINAAPVVHRWKNFKAPDQD